jgi:hypothetical protein
MMIPLRYAPGVCKVNSPYSDQGARFTDMDKVRFDAGYPEGIWNWILIKAFGDSDNTGIAGARGMKVFKAADSNIYIAYGTYSHLRYFTIATNDPTALQPITGNTDTDITPLRVSLTGTLTNPLDTTITSATVTVNHTSHGLTTGDYVQLVTGTAVGGIQPTGIFTNITVVNANKYTFTNTSAATSSVTGGGGTVSYSYYRVTLSNPFDTVSGSPIVTVNHTAHGAVTGDFITIAGASAVGGITPSGEYEITKVNADKYTITHGSNASSTVTGGGGTPNFLYNIPTAGGIQGDFRIWSLDNYGTQLLASPHKGTIYIWDSSVGGRAYPMYNAPTGVLAMFVTPERFVMALGNSSNAMQIKWPDQTDYTNWTPSPTSTANTRTLQDGAFLVGGGAVRDGVSLIFSDSACYALNYTGDSFIYNSTLSGTKCGLPGPLAFTVMEGIGYWFSGQDFWTWNGGVQRLPADDIRDYVVSDFYNLEGRQCVVGSHVAKNEVWVSYVSTADYGTYQIPSRYVIYFPDQQCWANGTFHITSWADSGLLPCPVFAAWGEVIQQSYFNSLDYGINTAGFQFSDTAGLSFVKTSPIDISDGYNMDVFSFIPDTKTLGGTGLTLTIYTQDYPQSSESTQGSYSITSSTPLVGTRFSAKLVSFKLASTSIAASTNWRLGIPRIEAQAGGSRR